MLLAASAAFERGDAAAGESFCRQILLDDPEHIDALSALGYVQLLQARHGEALPLFDKLCRLQPDEPAHWSNLGEAYRGLGQFDEALAAYGRTLELGDDSAGLHYNLGLAHISRGDFESARVVLGDALERAPGDDEVRLRYVQCCYECLRPDDALAVLDRWTPSPDTPAAISAGIGQALMNLGEYARAEVMLSDAVAGAQGDPRVSLMLVQVLERTNRLDESSALLQRLLAEPAAASLGPDLLRVSARLAQRTGQHEQAVRLYKQSMTDLQQFHERHQVLFALAESMHALGLHDEVVATLAEAHASQAANIRRNKPVTAARGTPQMVVTEYRCDPADVALWDHSLAPDAAHSPVFVVAFPRSGTTLLELTLDAHPLLQSMDEQPFVQNVLDDIVAQGILYPEQLGKLSATQLDQLRANYWQRAGRKVTLASGQRLVDKNPLNILRLPVIRRVFPNAPILLAIRHPCDVILSCYMQHFRAPDFSLMCADISALTWGYRKAFDFWYDQAALLRPNVMEVRYESFVADFEANTRSIMQFLELPWDPAVLLPADRARAKRFISTPSYSQVVQPVNQKSVGRWQAYRKYLEPALPIVEPYLRRWSYSG